MLSGTIKAIVILLGVALLFAAILSILFAFAWLMDTFPILLELLGYGLLVGFFISVFVGLQRWHQKEVDAAVSRAIFRLRKNIGLDE